MNRLVAVPFFVLALAGCARNIDRPIPIPPPPRAEMIPLRPATGQALIWQPGDWQWTGREYLWTPGRYVTRGNHSNMWLPGHWEGVSGNYRWVPGRWL